jgi:uncharacterized protein YneF (UPF0154 family)
MVDIGWGIWVLIGGYVLMIIGFLIGGNIMAKKQEKKE